MDYVGIISKLLICIFEAYIYYDFFKNIFEYRSSKKIVHIGLLALMAIAIWLVNCQDNSLLNVCMVPVLFFVFNCFLYKESIRNRILYVIVFFVVMMGIELIFEIIFSVACGLQHIEVMENPYNWTLIVMVEKTISLIVFRIIKYINNKIGNYIDRKLYRWVYILPITSLIIFVGFIYSDISIGVISIPKAILLMGCFMLLFSNAIVFYLFEKASQLMYQASQLEIHNMESKHYERIEEVNQEHRKFIHDLQHYLRTISSLSQQGNNDEINEVLKEMKYEVREIQSKTYCAYPILNAILCEKENQAKQLGIEYTAEIEPIVDLTKISKIDLMTIIGNLLNNAIEAASKCAEQRYVQICIRTSKEHFCDIQIENQCHLVRLNSI